MFESLEEQIKIDEHKGTTTKEMVIRWGVIVLISVLIVGGGLYFGLHLMGGS